MNEITALIWLLHPIALNAAIAEYQNGAELDEAAAEVIAAVYTDDAFNEYNESELQAAICEEITNY